MTQGTRPTDPERGRPNRRRQWRWPWRWAAVVTVIAGAAALTRTRRHPVGDGEPVSADASQRVAVAPTAGRTAAGLAFQVAHHARQLASRSLDKAVRVAHHPAEEPTPDSYVVQPTALVPRQLNRATHNHQVTDCPPES